MIAMMNGLASIGVKGFSPDAWDRLLEHSKMNPMDLGMDLFFSLYTPVRRDFLCIFEVSVHTL